MEGRQGCFSKLNKCSNLLRIVLNRYFQELIYSVNWKKNKIIKQMSALADLSTNHVFFFSNLWPEIKDTNSMNETQESQKTTFTHRLWSFLQKPRAPQSLYSKFTFESAKRNKLAHCALRKHQFGAWRWGLRTIVKPCQRDWKQSL